VIISLPVALRHVICISSSGRKTKHAAFQCLDPKERKERKKKPADSIKPCSSFRVGGRLQQLSAITATRFIMNLFATASASSSSFLCIFALT
jgi:hypothetical protein